MMWSQSGMMWSLPVVFFILTSTLGTTQGQCTSGSTPCQLTCRCSDPNSCPAGVPSGCGSQGCQPGWSGDTCQRQNTVYEFTNSPETSGILDSLSISGSFYRALAFDGLPNTAYRSESQDNPYLWVNLQNAMYVYSMRITTRGTNINQQIVQIHVSDSNTFAPSGLCYQGTITTTLTEYNITCTRALRGRYVRIQVLSTTTLIVQGWEIYRCADYWFGDGCSRLCNCRNPTQRCNELSGHCGSGCPDGYTGTECYTACPAGRFGEGCQGVCHCKNQASCGKANGACDGQGCAPGYMYMGGNCQQVCPNYRFGEGCRSECHCKNQVTCDKEDGTCVGGCAAGYRGGNCQQVCPNGQFGEECLGVCHCKNQASCDKVDGTCDAQGCDVGYIGDNCQDMETPEECEDGQFWENCELRCHCVNSEPCHKVTGICSSGCAPGFTGPSCQSVCPDGRYGLNCTGTCNCVRSESCDNVIGSCEGGCSPGYTGSDCQSECPSGIFGSECAHQCNCYDENEVCDRVNGTCQTGCADGHVGLGCLKAANALASEKPWGYIAAVVVVGIICAALMMSTIISSLKWRRFRRLYQKEIKARYVTYKVKPEEGTPVYEEVGAAPTQPQS